MVPCYILSTLYYISKLLFNSLKTVMKYHFVLQINMLINFLSTESNFFVFSMEINYTKIDRMDESEKNGKIKQRLNFLL